jgi:23S rRNA pseudouridine1911/1915/1917 synthase
MSDSKSEVFDVVVPEGVEGRVDVVLAESTDLSRTRIQGLIANGAVLVDGKSVNKRFRVSGGESISVEVPPAEPVNMIAQDLPLDIVYQDESIVVVNKAAGMVVHPAPGHRDGTLVNALLYHLDDLSGVGGRLRPGIVHRLDKDTSGLLVVAKTDAAHHALQAALKVRDVRRVYTAVSWGHLSEAELTIEAPLGRHPNDRVRMAVVRRGKAAITHVRAVERFLAAELLEVRLETGRTHQIRVHLLHTGHPVAGDSVYGVGWNRGMSGAGLRWAREFLALLPRQFLHASELSFDHPETGKSLTFRSELPSDLAASLAWARDNATG